MSVYLIAKITINDRQRYAQYEAGFMDIFNQYSGRMLSVDEEPTVIEGNWQCTRSVLIEFPSHEDAMAWYNSEAYQAIAQHRFAASQGNAVILNGLP